MHDNKSGLDPLLFFINVFYLYYLIDVMKSNFLIALTQLAAERNLDRDTILSAVEEALSSTFKKESLKSGHNISVKLDTETGDFNVYVVKNVVEEVLDSSIEISLKDAKKINAKELQNG